MPHWYLIHTKPAAESIAESNLQRQGYEVYYPRLNKPVRQSERWLDRVVALFPRYLFLRLDEGRQSLTPVRSTKGVAGVVRFGFSYAVVPDRVIGDLRARADTETGLHRLSRTLVLTPGAPVRVSMGPFEGLEGVFERAAGSDRVIVLLKLLGQVAKVKVPMDSVTRSTAFA